MGLKLMSTVAILLPLACVQSASAAGACGPGFYWGPNGCRMNSGVTLFRARYTTHQSRARQS